jgi:hypothetical protein
MTLKAHDAIGKTGPDNSVQACLAAWGSAANG